MRDHENGRPRGRSARVSLLPFGLVLSLSVVSAQQLKPEGCQANKRSSITDLIAIAIDV